jgi:hypothetical protein
MLLFGIMAAARADIEFYGYKGIYFAALEILWH